LKKGKLTFAPVPRRAGRPQRAVKLPAEAPKQNARRERRMAMWAEQATERKATRGKAPAEPKP
jgi:hypothetical protein